MAGNDQNGPRWYVSRKEIEENFSSRKDGIDLKKETYLRKSYCTFLQDLGIKLKVPQVTIATAIVFCHRFFLHQSHAKNDRKTIATVCMFLAGKVEETPRPLKDVILVSHEIIHKRDPVAIQRIKQKEVYEKRKEVILLGERVVLTTLDFDLNVSHPYRPLVAAIKKFNVAQHTLAQVAWNFVNDGLRTSLCLQFKPPHIAAGAIFLAAKFLKVKLPTEGDRNWWQEFDVTPRQLEDVSNQMLELYEQNRPGQSSHANEGSSGGGATNTVVTTTSTGAENSVLTTAKHIGVTNIKQAAQVAPSARPTGSTENNRTEVPPRQHSGNSNSDIKSGVCESEMISTSGEDAKDKCQPNTKIDTDKVKTAIEERSNCHSDVSNSGSKSGFWEQDTLSTLGEDAKDQCPTDAITKIDVNKAEAAPDKHQKIQKDTVKKNFIMSEEDPIEMEHESARKLVLEDEKLKADREPGWSNSLIREIPKNQCFKQAGVKGEGKFRVSEHLPPDGRTNPKLIDSENLDNAEEEELSSLDEHETPSPKLKGGKTTNSRKRPEDMSGGEFHHQLRQTHGTRELDCSQRSLVDHELPSAELVNEEGMDTGKPWEGKRLRDFPHPSRESAGNGWPDHSEIYHKRQRLHG